MRDGFLVALVLVAGTVFTPETSPSHRCRFFVDGLLIIAGIHEHPPAVRLLLQSEPFGGGANILPQPQLAGVQQPRTAVLLPAPDNRPELVLAHVNGLKYEVPPIGTGFRHLVAGQRDALALDFLPFFPRLSEGFLHELTEQFHVAAVRHRLCRQLPLREHGLAPFRPRGNEDGPVTRADALRGLWIGVQPTQLVTDVELEPRRLVVLVAAGTLQPQVVALILELRPTRQPRRQRGILA